MCPDPERLSQSDGILAGRRMVLSAIAGLGAIAAPLGLFAQSPAKVWRIGVLHPRTRDTLTNPYLSFFDTLRELGYVDGRNINVQWSFAANDIPSLSVLAAQLVASKVDLIVTNGTP